MRHISLLLIFVFLTSCELIVIGTKKKTEVIDYDQNSPLGAVFLFKTELDSNNIPAATQILASPEGVKYLAFEQYQLYYELERINRLIGLKPITKITTDSLGFLSYAVNVEFDYLQNVTFTTKKIKDHWFIIGYGN